MLLLFCGKLAKYKPLFSLSVANFTKFHTFEYDRIILKEISVIIFSSFKFAMTFPLAILEYKMGVLKTILWTNIGGLLGIFLFAFLSEQLIYFWRNYIVNRFHIRFRSEAYEPRQKKVFTRRNRRIVRIKSKYGLAGIAFATPILLSIPVGAFLIVRYFDKKPNKLIYLAGANLIWSVLYAFFYAFFYEFYVSLF